MKNKEQIRKEITVIVLTLVLSASTVLLLHSWGLALEWVDIVLAGIISIAFWGTNIYKLFI